MDTNTGFSVGTRVNAAPHEHAVGKCFLSGPGVVVENRDVISRLAGDVVVRFDSGVTGRFKTVEAETLVTV